jgi:hypothetical protein
MGPCVRRDDVENCDERPVRRSSKTESEKRAIAANDGTGPTGRADAFLRIELGVPV